MNKDEIKKAEDTAILKSEKGDKPYRKAYRPKPILVTCYDCGVHQDLRLITTKRKDSFKRAGHKKNRNDIAIVCPDGNKVYLCSSCVEKRAKSTK